jgi:hypothetical protein
MDLDKKFISEIIKFWGFIADIDPKIIFFGMHIKFPKIIRLPKKLFILTNIYEKRSKKRFLRFLIISMGYNFFIFFP